MPIVSAFASASLSPTLVRPMAVPAAARIAVSSAPMPIATSQPKKAEPQLKPPNSSRWRARTSCGAGAAIVAALVTVLHAVVVVVAADVVAGPLRRALVLDRRRVGRARTLGPRLIADRDAAAASGVGAGILVTSEVPG